MAKIIALIECKYDFNCHDYYGNSCYFLNDETGRCNKQRFDRSKFPCDNDAKNNIVYIQRLQSVEESLDKLLCELQVRMEKMNVKCYSAECFRGSTIFNEFKKGMEKVIKKIRMILEKKYCK